MTEVSCINIKPSKPGRRFDLQNIQQEQLYQSPRAISDLKFRESKVKQN